MRRILAAILALLLIAAGAAMAEDMDLTSFTDEELNGLERAIAMERELRSELRAEAAAAAEAEAAAQAEAEETETEPEEEPEPVVLDAESFQPLAVGSKNEFVRALQEKLRELGFKIGSADGIYGPKTQSAVKALQEMMGWDGTGQVGSFEAFDVMRNLAVGDGVNCAIPTSADWSDWMTPAADAENKTFAVAYAYPGEMTAGETVTCQVEVEFRDVKATEDKNFSFRAQGAVDGSWDLTNVWNSKLVNLVEAPSDGVYRYTSIQFINENNKDAGCFYLSFRRDNWAQGAFRVRGLKVEKGAAATAWSMAPAQESDGINLVADASPEWSEWMTPEANAENRTFKLGTVELGEKILGMPYTCQVEIEFQDVKAAEDKDFVFRAQGAVDGGWSKENIWNSGLIRLNEAPANSVGRYTHTAMITPGNVDATSFDLCFRCDNWSAGSFRVRCLKVEKGAVATEWSAAE